jgi:nickel/cobalt transporter (NicO) family protein
VTTAPALSPAVTDRRRLLARLVVAAAAVALVGALVALIAWLVTPAAPPPMRSPFGVGVREAAPAAGGLGGIILALQSQFFRSLQTAVAALKENSAAVWSLVAIGFAYGVFHAAGPGHGKAVIAAYLVSDERALAKGVGLSLAAALVQGCVAVAVVAVVAALFRATAGTMTQVTNVIEAVSFAAVAALGAVLVWRKAGKLVAAPASLHDHQHGHRHEHGHGHAHHACDHACGHTHVLPQAAGQTRRWRDAAGVVFAAGIRPCTGAIVILVFTLSQGLFLAGVAATFAMALGTALTTGAIAALAVFAKSAAVRLSKGRAMRGDRVVAGLELTAAAFVLVLGMSLLAGLWTTSAAS